MYNRVDVSQGLRINALYTAFTEKIHSDYFFVGERHNFWELVCVLSGKVGVTAGEDARVLENNVSRNLSIEEIAALCAMSPVSVKQTFSRYAGMGVMNYFNRLKIQAAAAMLREGASVQETAAALGFSSQNYFSTVFKRIQGESPTAYKDQVFGK